MTRKDYVALAKVIRKYADDYPDGSSDWKVNKVLGQLVSDLVPILKAENRNFQADKFITACGFDATEGW